MIAFPVEISSGEKRRRKRKNETLSLRDKYKLWLVNCHVIIIYFRILWAKRANEDNASHELETNYARASFEVESGMVIIFIWFTLTLL